MMEGMKYNSNTNAHWKRWKPSSTQGASKQETKTPKTKAQSKTKPIEAIIATDRK